jgi:hypothetical protein
MPRLRRFADTLSITPPPLSRFIEILPDARLFSPPFMPFSMMIFSMLMLPLSLMFSAFAAADAFAIFRAPLSSFFAIAFAFLTFRRAALPDADAAYAIDTPFRQLLPPFSPATPPLRYADDAFLSAPAEFSFSSPRATLLRHYFDTPCAITPLRLLRFLRHINIAMIIYLIDELISLRH